MLKRLTLASMAAALVACMGYAQTTNNVTIPVTKTPATSGKQMFVNYCAPCHGVDGTGQGPVSSSLKMPPADLTLLSKNNGGQFPDAHLAAVLKFGAQTPAHGSAEMPVWGPVLGKMDQRTEENEQLRISNLIRYLKTIQVK